MNRQTILYVHHGKGLGGAPISLLTLIKGLDLTRYHPVVLFLYDSDAMTLFRDEGIEVVGPINLSDFPHTKMYWFRWYHLHHAIKALMQTLKTLFITAPRIIREIKPTLIQLNTSSLIAWGIAAHYLKVPVIWHIRESLAAGYFGIRRFILKKIIARCANAIVPICQTDGRLWTNAKKTVLYNPVDTARFKPAIKEAQSSNAPQYLLFVGGLSHQKGTLLMLEVFAAVKKIIPDIKLVIAGSFNKPEIRGLQKFSPEKNYMATAYALYEKQQNDIILTGPTKNIPALMQAASIIFFPAQVDHFARPIIEAGCVAKPVIASDLPQLREIIEHERTGYLLPSNDAAAWVKTTISLLDDEAKQQKIGSALYDFCIANCTQKQYVQNMQALYQRLSKEHNEP